MNFSALLACLGFYSGIYLLYFFFMREQNPILLLAGIGLLVFTVILIPYPHERRRRGFDSTLTWGNYLLWPLFTWWRVFIMPISWLISLIYRD
ncbi:hypothetical protein BS636_09380 [Acinetobacter sp. LoGeW2-3]|uniref:hypothetical protein n=1 Tax=Acinetobacter sp. LoGeW2-3 TaxID=1808001 RepID=UPI000C058F2A|nr:hypothetical protein [Acinetobacter sp. LoGeW2-3]ATO19844.1 hypothetical protein BS636_09380 [Acinetobacter sp. LoGeW2-3]